MELNIQKWNGNGVIVIVKIGLEMKSSVDGGDLNQEKTLKNQSGLKSI